MSTAKQIGHSIDYGAIERNRAITPIALAPSRLGLILVARQRSESGEIARHWPAKTGVRIRKVLAGRDITVEADLNAMEQRSLRDRRVHESSDSTMRVAAKIGALANADHRAPRREI